MVISGVLTMPLAVVLQIMPFYNILHDHFAIHTEVCAFLVIGLYVLIVWSGDRNKSNSVIRGGGQID